MVYQLFPPVRKYAFFEREIRVHRWGGIYFMALFRKRESEMIPYDREAQQPAVRRSICTGEMTLGFTDKDSGRFHEYLLARDARELEDFCRRTGVTPETLRTIY